MLYVHVLARLNEDLLVLDTMREDVDTMLDVVYDNLIEQDSSSNDMRVMLESVEAHLMEKQERTMAQIYKYEQARAPIGR